jgi:hypothetical protein
MTKLIGLDDVYDDDHRAAIWQNRRVTGPHPGQVVESMLTEMREQLKDFEARTDTLGRRL